MSKQPAPRLGKGLSAILGARKPHSDEGAPDGASTTASPARAPAGRASESSVAPLPPGATLVRELAIETVVPNPQQPRTHFESGALEELAGSIRVNGVLQPVVVRAQGDRFELIAGERRLRAAKLAGLRTIPALVREVSDEQSLELALVENIQRQDLSPLERARAYQAYVDAFQVSPEILAGRLGESRSNVVNYLRLLRLPQEVIDFIERGELGMGQARAILGLTSPERQLAVARLAVRRNLSVRLVEQMVRQGADNAVSRETRVVDQLGVDRHMEHLQQSIGKALGLKVRVMQGRKKNSGRLVIHYASLEEFDRFAERLGISIE